MADPVNTVPPVISGTPTVGQTLSCNTGTWTNTPTSYAYQWQRETGVSTGIYANITGVTVNQYALGQPDVGLRIRCEVTATNNTSVTDVFPGGWNAALAAASDGSTLFLRGGTHNMISANRSFSTSNPLKVICESGTLVKGVLLTDGANGYVFGDANAAPYTDTFVARILAADTPDLNDISVRTFNIDGHVTNVKVVNARLQGGFITYSPYSGGTACGSLELRGSIIENAWGDLSHPNNCNGLIIDHNIFRNPQHLTAEHHDCFQPQSTSNFQFTRNICYWTSGPGAFAGYTVNYLGQCVMLSGNAGANSNGYIANNLFHHFNGRAVNMNNSSGIVVVNNTIDKCGDGIGITMGTGMSNHEIWNNIMECAFLEGPTPLYFDYNWLTGENNYFGNIQGNNFWEGAPGWIDTTNYELTLASPARTKGINRSSSISLGTPTIDLDGNVRPSTPGLGCRV